MRRIVVIWAIGVFVPLAASAQGTFRVRFDQSVYSVTPDGTIAVGVVIDPTPAAGLFSYGLKIAFDQAWARVESASAVSVPPPLNFNGVLGPGAIRVIQDGAVGVKGTIDFSTLPAEFYSGGLLATISLRNLESLIGKSYPLNLELFRTLGPSESVFVTGDGQTLDGNLIFGSAMVTVVPEPSSALLLFVGGLLLRKTEVKRFSLAGLVFRRSDHV